MSDMCPDINQPEVNLDFWRATTPSRESVEYEDNQVGDFIIIKGLTLQQSIKPDCAMDSAADQLEGFQYDEEMQKYPTPSILIPDKPASPSGTSRSGASITTYRDSERFSKFSDLLKSSPLLETYDKAMILEEAKDRKCPEDFLWGVLRGISLAQAQLGKQALKEQTESFEAVCNNFQKLMIDTNSTSKNFKSSVASLVAVTNKLSDVTKDSKKNLQRFVSLMAELKASLKHLGTAPSPLTPSSQASPATHTDPFQALHDALLCQGVSKRDIPRAIEKAKAKKVPLDQIDLKAPIQSLAKWYDSHS